MVSTVLVVSVTAGVVAEVSILIFVESVVVESVLVFESSQAANIDATAKANNTFFIFGVLIINYLFAINTIF